MSEHAPSFNPENLDVLVEKHEKALPTAEQAEALRPGEADPTLQLEAARNAVEKTAESAVAHPLERARNDEQPASVAPTHVNRELKAITLRRELQRIQRKLPRGQRTLSKIVHQPVIQAISEVGAKTVSRPSGLLGGGILAFIGSSSYLYLAKHIGFQYNYLVFLMLFVAGFLVGVIMELLVHLVTARNRNEI